MTPAHLGRVWIYIHLAADGSVLYVGKTYKLQKRTEQHVGRSPWRSEIHTVRAFGPYLDDHARRMERWLIEHLDPPHNYVFTSRWWEATHRSSA